MLSKLFELNKNPVLYQLGNFYFIKFGLYAALGAFFGMIMVSYFINISGSAVSILSDAGVVLIALGILVGSRLFHLIASFKKVKTSPTLILKQTVFYDQGGNIAALIIVIIYSYLTGINLLIVGDAVAFGGSLALAFGRLGCYSYGCCFGKPTNSTFGTTYNHPQSKILTLYPHYKDVKIYPVQLYMSMFNFSLFILFNIYIQFFNHAGVIMISYLILYNIFRIIIHRYRANDTQVEKGADKDEISYLVTAVLLLLTGVALIVMAMTNILPLTTYQFSTSGQFGGFISVISQPILLWALLVSLLYFLLMGIHYKRIGQHF